MVRLIEYRQLANILAMFLIVQLAGLFLVFYLITPTQVFVSQSVTGSAGGISPTTVVLYVIYIVVAALIMSFIFKKKQGPRVFAGLDFFVIVPVTFYLFLIVLSILFPQGIIYAVLISIFAALGLFWAKRRWPRLRNITTLIASIGAGFLLGLVFGTGTAQFPGFLICFFFMALIAVYDYVAVFVTKHMITLGRGAVENNLAMMVDSYEMEVMPKGYLKAKEAAHMSNEFKNTKSETLRQLMKEGNVPMPSFSALGAGDLALPLMLAVGAYVTYFSYFFSAILAFGSCFGLFFAMYVSKRYQIALPAIPPLFAFASISFGVYLLFTAPGAWTFYALLFLEGIVVLAIMLITAINVSRKGVQSRRIVPTRA